MLSTYFGRILLLLILLLFMGSPHAAQREDAIKAGLIFNFAVYSHGDWFNPEIDTNYVICSSSQAFVDTAQRVLKKKNIKKRPVQVVFNDEDQNNLKKCHTYFFAPAESAVDNTWTLKKELNESTMLIGESSGFINMGGHINFITLAGKLRFEINPDALHDSGINISSKVIRLGKVKKVVSQ